MLSKEDFWIGEAITGGRVAFECWDHLHNGKITVYPEFHPNSPGGGYVNIFENYSKREFLRSVYILHHGLFGDGKKKTPAALRMQELVPTEKIDEFRKLGMPFRNFRNEDEHRDDPLKSPVWTIQINEPRPTMGTTAGNRIDPLSVYEILKSLEPDIGYFAFVKGLRDG